MPRTNIKKWKIEIMNPINMDMVLWDCYCATYLQAVEKWKKDNKNDFLTLNKIVNVWNKRKQDPLIIIKKQDERSINLVAN